MSTHLEQYLSKYPTRKELATMIRKVQGAAPYKVWGDLADELAPPEKKPKPPDGWEFVLNDKGKRVKRAPVVGEWYKHYNECEAILAQYSVSEAYIRYILRRIPDPEGWLKEFYSEEAKDVPALRALDHGLQKFKGVLVLAKYGLKLRRYSKSLWDVADSDGGTVLVVGARSCALCRTHRCKESQWWRTERPVCPLDCLGDSRLWHNFCDTGDPEPMIAALEKAIAERDAKNYDAKLIAECKDAAEGMKAKPKPGEFVDLASGRLAEVISEHELQRDGRTPPTTGDILCVRFQDGHTNWVSLSAATPWTPKPGEAMWGRVDGTWHRGKLNKQYDETSWWFDCDDGREESIPLSSSRPLAFPPPKCCATCGARQ